MNIQSLLTKERSIHNDGTAHYPLKQLTDDEPLPPGAHTLRERCVTLRDPGLPCALLGFKLGVRP